MSRQPSSKKFDRQTQANTIQYYQCCNPINILICTKRAMTTCFKRKKSTPPDLHNTTTIIKDAFLLLREAPKHRQISASDPPPPGLRLQSAYLLRWRPKEFPRFNPHANALKTKPWRVCVGRSSVAPQEPRLRWCMHLNPSAVTHATARAGSGLPTFSISFPRTLLYCQALSRALRGLRVHPIPPC